VVKPGDTLWAIAHRHNSSVDEIAEVNGLSNADELTVGQSLFIPAPDDLAPPGDASPRPASPTSATPARDDKRPPPILAWPLDEGVLFSGFGPRHGSLHDGIDLGAPEGTPIRAAADGTVLFAGADPGAYGLLVILQHPEERITIYAHNQANLVKEGEQVKKGQVIAKVGRTGYVQGPHLHFELRQQRKPIDPVPFLPPE
jgi:murein DD-endopeptidase MepM/ murein hydrolase activator NlpD